VENPPHHPNGDFMLNGVDISMSGENRFTFSGLSIWDEQVFDSYPQGLAFPLVQPMHELIGRGACRGFLHRGDWFDIGRPLDLMRANRMMGGM
jgi:MurNAc alpha-1-phosphate uridylyltransferase